MIRPTPISRPAVAQRSRSSLFLALLFLVVAACGETRGPAGPVLLSQELAEPVQAVEMDVAMDKGLSDDLPAIQRLVFDRACANAGCHDALTRAGFLDLSSLEASRADLLGSDGVGVPVANAVAAENGWLRVDPGDPGRSFLVRKLRLPGAGEGAPMPLGPRQLTAPYVEQISSWIEQGAQP